MKDSEAKTEVLLERHREVWDHSQPFLDQRNGGLALRTYRAVTWLHRARDEPGDHFAAFLLYWVAFNALYGALPAEPDARERKAWRSYFERLLANDRARRSIHDVLRRLERPIAVLMTDELAYPPTLRPGSGFADGLDRGAGRVRQALKSTTGTDFVLLEVFSRLYNVRNWLIHGRIAWKSRIMGDCVTAGTDVMTRLIPALVEVMLGEAWPDEWEEPRYSPDVYEGTTTPKEIPAIGGGLE
ncbi:MAG: hypothetical protein F4029_15215 [Gammaproteobacteria bacterium]|nr:hypothetical protein [Gammaproteobacteria bacterium]MYF30484.1 hypothetical protein [Gammaproteobacteria bacterium]MYK47565.1 hypothetical protein [Gammaproteobacteria bacterium]